MANNITISRVENGNIQACMLNMNGENVGTLGEIRGSALLEFGTTDDGLESELMVGSFFGGANINVKDASQNISFWGANLNVDVSDNRHNANIQWNAVGSSLSALNTSRALTLEATESASDNIFTMGWGEAQIMDRGLYNITNLGAGNSVFTSTASCVGALVLGGSGKNTYNVGGNYGVFNQGSGISNFLIKSETEDTRTGHMNAIFADGQANITDEGLYSLIVSRNEKSKLTENGTSSIAIVNGNSKTKLGAQGDCSVVFADGQEEYKVSDYINLSLKNFLNDRGWTNKKELGDTAYNDFYLGITASNHAKHITGKTVAALLSEILEKGDEGYEAQHA